MKYTVIHHDDETREGSVHGFVEDLPGVIDKSGLIPPLSVMNDLFLSGELNLGMSGVYRWEPFSIDEAEYHSMVAKLGSSRRHTESEPPEWVTDFSSWSIWRLEVESGVPSADHRRLSFEIEKLKAKMYSAHAIGDTEKSRHYEVLMGELEMELAELINAQIKPNRG